jgi:tetratricopeptide (TPR) repeat protein
MAGLLQINVLGELQVIREGQLLALPPSRKTRALLAYLAVVGRPQRRERLCEMFWEIPDDPRGALRWSLSKLRQVAGHDTLVRADRNIVSLDPQMFGCDQHAIQSLAPDKIETLDVATLEKIAAEFRGDFLEDLYLPNCPIFEAWRVAQAAQASLVRLRALRLLIEKLESDSARALRYAHLLYALSPDDLRLAAKIDALTAAARIHTVAASQTPVAALQKPVPPVDMKQQVAVQASNARVLESAEPPYRGEDATIDQWRRQVSVIATEIISPFEDLQDGDPEADLGVVAPLFQIICRELEQHGGVLISSSDTSVVGLFGVGAIAEDHAIQSCRAALALTELNKLESGAGGLRIGLDSGEAILRRAQFGTSVKIEATGAVVRTARHLAQALKRNGVACSGRMRDVAGASMLTATLSLDDLDASRAIGSCYELLGENKVKSRWHLRRSTGLVPMVGRGHELLFLREAYAQVSSGAGQAFGIVGDAGIGKSRLIHEFITSHVPHSRRPIECGAVESDAIASLRIIKKLLRSFFNIEEDDPAPVAIDRVHHRVAALGADQSFNLPLLFALDLPSEDSAWVGLPPSERVRRMRNAILGMLILESRKALLVIVIEDLHWIDNESKAVIERLIDGIVTQPILLITTYRPEFQLSWAAKANFTQLRVNALSGPDAESLAGTLLGGDPSVQGLIPLIAGRTDGVPLFIEETVQAMVQDGALIGTASAYRTAGEITELQVPSTVQSVIAARIDRLQDDNRKLLQMAAFLGEEISLSILASIAQISEAAATERLAELQDSGFLHETQIVPAPVFQFKHALVRKVAYESLLQADRKRIHCRLIDTIEGEFPHLIDDYVERLAEHATAAERWDKAITYLLHSADRALQRSAHIHALSFLDKGLDLLAKQPGSPERSRTELQYQKRKGLAWMAAKGWGAAEVLQAYERAEQLCDELKDESERFTALRGRAQYYMISGQPRSAQAISLKCAGISKNSKDAGIAIETHHMFWTNNFFMGNCAEAERHADAAIELYNGDRHHALTYLYSGHDPGVCSCCVSGLSAWQQGNIEKATQRCRAALELAEHVSHPLTIALAYWGLSYLHMFRWEPEAVLGWAQREIAICDEYTLPLLKSQGIFQAGWAIATLGDAAAGIRQMREGIDAIRETGAEMGMPYFLGLLSEVIAKTGDTARALALLEESVRSALRNGAHFQYSELLRLKAEILLQISESNTAEIDSLFCQAIDVAHQQKAILPAFRAATARARFLTAHSRLAEAEEVLWPLRGLAARLEAAGIDLSRRHFAGT